MDILEQLEARIQQLLDNMGLMQMEIEELTEKNTQLEIKATRADELEVEVAKIRSEQTEWQSRLRHLLGRIDEVSDTNEATNEPVSFTVMNNTSSETNVSAQREEHQHSLL